MADPVVLTNGVVEVVVAAAFGPRILHFSYAGGSNVLGDAAELTFSSDLGMWRARGGHRLWVAPELIPGSYAPDNDPVEIVATDSRRVTVRQATDRSSIGKAIDVAIQPDNTVRLTHTLRNRGCWPIRIAPWALTIVSANGTALAPQPPFRSHDEDLLPARALVQWSFTDLTDPRWTFGKCLLRLTPDASRPAPQKIGLANAQGWCALSLPDVTFIKRFTWDPAQVYPDYGCNNEFYTAGAFLEIETLGPVSVLPPEGEATHVETWALGPPLSPATSEERQLAMLTEMVDHM